MADKSFFELNLENAQNRINSRTSETFFVSRDIPDVVEHLRKIKSENPDMTEEDMKKYLFEEIDSYAKTVFEITYVFSEYMEYISNNYLKSHSDKYKELSEEIKKDPNKWYELTYEECNTFDEYLSLYIFSLKKYLFDWILKDYYEETPENIANFDEIFSQNMGLISKQFFQEFYGLPEFSEVLTSQNLDRQKKIAKAKEFSNWFKIPHDKKAFFESAQLFIDGSFSFLKNDTPNLENVLKQDLAKSTEAIINNLESLGKLKPFIISHVSQLVSVGFPEFALPLCEGPHANLEYLSNLQNLSNKRIYSSLEDVVSVENLKKLLSINVLKSMPIENLLALNSFWSNRYIKVLESYSESMFAVRNFDLIHKVLNDEPIDINTDDITNMLIKMDTFYTPASLFLERQQRKIDIDSKKGPELELPSDDVESKIVRFSYEPFINLMRSRDGLEYKRAFSQILPNCQNDIGEDADWYIRLFNPIYSSYSLKDFSINSLIASIENSSNTFVNAGIILDRTPNGSLPSIIGIGIDAGLSSPIRIHTKKEVLIEFLKSLQGNAIIPIYAGADDFINPEKGNLLPIHIVTPLSDKLQKTLKKAGKSLEQYRNPNLVAHLGFLNPKCPPLHLCDPSSIKANKKKGTLAVKYIDLETGDIYIKSNDEYAKVSDDTYLGGDAKNEI